jgi:hypothetical protein
MSESEHEDPTCRAPGCNALGTIGRHRVVRGKVVEYRWWCFAHEDLADAAKDAGPKESTSLAVDLFGAVISSR